MNAQLQPGTRSNITRMALEGQNGSFPAPSHTLHTLGMLRVTRRAEPTTPSVPRRDGWSAGSAGLDGIQSGLPDARRGRSSGPSPSPDAARGVALDGSAAAFGVEPRPSGPT